VGQAGDWLRDKTGGLTGVLDAVVPSAQRGAATSETLGKIGSAVSDYIGAVAADPGRLKTDIINAIDAQWSRLEASHAAAAAQGPQAEARWWGETVGRVSFEVAATFVPVAGQAGKVGTVARVADGAVDAARIGDTVGDAARVADTVGDAARVDEAGDAARAAQAADGATDASRAARAGQVIEHTFGSNTVRYSYDAQGRLVSARAQLSEVYSGLERSGAEEAAQRDVARLGQTGDQGGHAVGHRFLGDQGERAMFPQNGVPRDVVINGETVRLKNLNSGAFARLENEIADWIRAGGRVEYNISFSNFDGVRPGDIRIDYQVMDDAGDVVFENTQRFANEAGQKFDRVGAADMHRYFK
jgi:YD repeat-containing protein